MKKYLIEIEVDDNVTIEEMESAIQAAIDNSINTSEAFYEVTEVEKTTKEEKLC